MPRLSYWIIRCALVYLVMGFSVGTWMLLAKAMGAPEVVGRWRPIHAELLLMGWLIQLVVGVSYWILPRLDEQNRRGYEPFVWLAVLLLNMGIWLSCAGFWMGRPWLLAIGHWLELSGLLLYALALLPRLRRPLPIIIMKDAIQLRASREGV